MSSLPQAIETIRPSVVQISLLASDLSDALRERLGTTFISDVLGTGFIVDRNLVITARHVIREGMRRRDQYRIDARRANLHVGFALPTIQDNRITMRENFSIVPFDIVAEDPQHDLALLRIGEEPSGVVIRWNDRNKEVPIEVSSVQLYTEMPRDGQAIATSGYPFAEMALITNAGHIASIWTTPNYLADFEVNPGNSGGPVYLVENAQVIGVCVARRGTTLWWRDDRGSDKIFRLLGRTIYSSSGVAHVVPSSHVRNLMDEGS